MSILWLSFADPDRPQGDQFLGVSIVEADNLFEAICAAREQGINPGGEVIAHEIGDQYRAFIKPFMGRLLNREDATLAARGPVGTVH